MTLARAALGLVLVALAVSAALPVPADAPSEVAWLHLVPMEGWQTRLDADGLVDLRPAEVDIDRDAKRLRVPTDLPDAADAFLLTPNPDGSAGTPRLHAFTGRLAVVWHRNGTTATFEVDLDEDRLRVMRFPGTQGFRDAGETHPNCPTRVERSIIGHTPLAVSQQPLVFDVRIPPGSSALLELQTVGDLDCPVGAAVLEHMGTWRVAR